MPLKKPHPAAPPPAPDSPWYEKAFEPLIPTGVGKAIGDSISEPRLDDSDYQVGLNDSPWKARWEGFKAGSTPALKGFLGGAAEGLGNVVAGFSSPVSLAGMLSGVGEARAAASGASTLAKALQGVEVGANAAFGAHGAKQVLDPNTSIPQKIMGGVEGVAGLLGVKKGVQGWNTPSATPTPKPKFTVESSGGRPMRDIQPSGSPVPTAGIGNLPWDVEPGHNIPYSIPEPSQAVDPAKELDQLNKEWKLARQAKDNEYAHMAKGNKQLDDAAEIDRIREANGMEPGIPTSRSTVSANGESVTTPWSVPEEDVVEPAPNKAGVPPVVPAPQGPSGSPLGRMLTPKEAREASYQELLARLKAEGTTTLPVEAAPSVEPPLPTTTPEPATEVTPAPAPKARPANVYSGHPEVEAAFDELGNTYRGGDKSKGKELAELRDFMSGGKMRESWKGGPEAVVNAAMKAEAARPENVAFIENLKQIVKDAADKARSNVAPAVEPINPEAAGITQKMEALPQAEPATPPIEPPLESTPPEYKTAGDWVGEENARLDDPTGFMDKLRGQKGAIDPMLMARLGLSAGGAAYGAATGDTPKNRLARGVIGAGAGFLAPSAPGIVSKIAESDNIPEAIGQAAMKAARLAPNVQRANYLMDMKGLIANAVAGPYGSAVLGALKHTMASPWTGDTRGIEALKNLSPWNFGKQYFKSWQEAKQLLEHGELGKYEGQVNEGAPGYFEKGIRVPGNALTAGDVAGRSIMQNAGFSEPEARNMTLTNEPELSLFKSIAGFGRGGSNDITKSIGEMLFPFKRTPANIGEQALMNMPGLGSYFQSLRKNPDSVPLQIAGQTINAGVGGLSYYAGLHMDPNDPNTRTARRFLTNAAGPHGAMAAAAFAIGQAHRAGKSATDDVGLNSGVTAGVRQGLPLPSIEPIQDWTKFVTSGFDMKNLPAGAMPADIKDALVPPPPPSLHPLRKIRR